MPSNNLSKTKQKEIKDLIEKGRQQGFLTIGEINDLLPTNLYDADQIDGIIKLITDLKIKVVESNKDIETEVVIGDEEITDGILKKTKRRFTWLLLNLFTAIIASIVIGFFVITLYKFKETISL